MSKNVVFKVDIDDELKDAFVAATEANHKDASAVMRDFMQDYVERQTLSYEDFLRKKLERSRQQAEKGQLRSNENVEAEFTARRENLLDIGS